MSRLTIQQFRAHLTGRSHGDLVRAYRRRASRPDVEAAMLARGWIPWQEASVSTTHA